MISTIKQRAFVWHPTADRIEEPRKAKVPAKQRQIGCCQTNVHTSSKLPRFVEQTLRAPQVHLPEPRNDETVARLVINVLQHLPEIGEAVETLGWRFEVIDVDGRRVDKVLARRSGDERDRTVAVDRRLRQRTCWRLSEARVRRK
jgi:hypothetical protein